MDICGKQGFLCVKATTFLVIVVKVAAFLVLFYING